MIKSKMQKESNKRKKHARLSLISAIYMATFVMLSGCGAGNAIQSTGNDVSAQNDDVAADTGSADADGGEADLIEYDRTGDGQGFKSEEAGEENPWDGGPDWESLAYRFTIPTYNMTIEDAVNEHAITLKDGGKYTGYEGDIGDVIPDYKGMDLDGDHKPDVINRVGNHYVFEFSKLGPLVTRDYTDSPNEGEVFEFDDLACRNIDEIFVEHYTFGTGGPVVWNTYVYSWQNGEWREFTIVDEDTVINSSELQEHIVEETGEPYWSGSVRVAGIKLSTLLLDFGHKDGPQQIWDYKYAYLHKNFSPGYVDETDEFTCFDISADMGLVTNWPYELKGEEIDLTPDLQKKLNVYLSNFSEVGFRDDDWPNSYAHFALEWAKLNDMSRVVMRDDKYCISHSDINRILDRYMGTNLEEGDMSDIVDGDPERHYGATEYFDDQIWYTEPLADGEMYKNNAFTVVNDAQRVSFDYYDYLRLEFTVYSLDTDVYDEVGTSQYYAVTPEEARQLEADGTLIKVHEGLAFAQDVGEDGYWLTYYEMYD